MSWSQREEVVAGRRMVARASRAAARRLTGLAQQLSGAPPAGEAGAAAGGTLAGASSKYTEHWLAGNEATARSMILEGTDSFFEGSGRAMAEGRLAALLAPDSTAVDLGCGIGRIGLYVAPLCRTLWAVDASPTMLTMAQERLSGFTNVRYARCLDTRVPDIADGSVDVVYSILVLQHLEKEDAFLLMRDVVRMLAPGGRALLTFPNILADEYLRTFIDCAEKGRACIDVSARTRFYTLAEVERLTLAAGFSSVELEEGTDLFALCTK